MRIYLPLSAEDRAAISQGAAELELPVGRPAWAVHPAVRAEHPTEDVEDLEYEALQDAVHVALGAVDERSRALVLAADVPDGDLGEGEDEDGAFGVRTRRTARARIASLHVTELDARAAEADDTDPALLWFDPSERDEALAYLDARPGGDAPR